MTKFEGRHRERLTQAVLILGGMINELNMIRQEICLSGGREAFRVNSLLSHATDEMKSLDELLSSLNEGEIFPAEALESATLAHKESITAILMEARKIRDGKSACD